MGLWPMFIRGKVSCEKSAKKSQSCTKRVFMGVECGFFTRILTAKYTKHTKLRDTDGVERKDAKAQRRKVDEYGNGGRGMTKGWRIADRQ